MKSTHGALALAQGEVHVMALPAPFLIQFKDKIQPVAALSDKRISFFPELRTAREQGMDIPTLSYWGGLAAPLGTPKSAIDTLEKALKWMGDAVKSANL